MATRKKRISVYLSDSLYQALIAYQEQQTLNSASSAVSEILNQFFQLNQEKGYATIEQLTALEAKVTQLSEQLAQLGQVVDSATPAPAATSMPVRHYDFNVIPKLPQLSASAFANMSYEEVEDEPDEILYDFLQPEG